MWLSFRALGPSGKCAPELERKQNRARLDGSPGSLGMGTLLHLYPPEVPLAMVPCSSRPSQQVVLGAGLG